MHKTEEIRIDRKMRKTAEIRIDRKKTETVVTNLSPNGYISELCGK